jgi:hypothetical protein
MLRCPHCSAPNLEQRFGIELGPDDSSDEVSFSVLRCDACGFAAAGHYEESRRGREARWHHYGIAISLRDYARVIELLVECPDRRDYHCTCHAHRFFGRGPGTREIRSLSRLRRVQRDGFKLRLATE